MITVLLVIILAWGVLTAPQVSLVSAIIIFFIFKLIGGKK